MKTTKEINQEILLEKIDVADERIKVVIGMLDNLHDSTPSLLTKVALADVIQLLEEEI